MRGIIYVYTSLVTGKSYVGQTINEDNRKRQHIRASYKKCTFSKFHRELKEQGIENFKYEVVFEIEGEDKENIHKILDEKEEYYICLYDSYNNGYNSTSDGKFPKIIAYNKSKGTNLKNKGGKLIYCVETGKTYKTYKECANVLGVDIKKIKRCCSGIQKETRGYHFSFVEDEIYEDVSKIVDMDRLERFRDICERFGFDRDLINDVPEWYNI